jgi:hypothetical protein
MKTDNGSANCSMTCELQSTLAPSGIEWRALSNHKPYMAHVIQQALSAFVSCHCVNGRAQSWEANQRDPQFGE